MLLCHLGQIDSSIDLEFNVNSTNFRKLDVINKIEVLEARDKEDYSMIIYFVKPDDTLWKIAKKFNSTVEDISRVNGIEVLDLLQVRKTAVYTKI